jgi:hypothetical protein
MGEVCSIHENIRSAQKTEVEFLKRRDHQEPLCMGGKKILPRILVTLLVINGF